MNWFKLAMTIIQMLIQYGPSIYKLGKSAYDMVEDISSQFKTETGTGMTSTEKKTAFNAEIEKTVELTPAGLSTLREGVWAVKNKRPLGSKP